MLKQTFAFSVIVSVVAANNVFIIFLLLNILCQVFDIGELKQLFFMRSSQLLATFLIVNN